MPKIDNTYFGAIIINGRKFDSDVVLDWTGDIKPRPGSHSFTKADLNELMMRDPEVIIVGTGTAGNVKVDADAEIAAKMHGVELIAMLTPLAVAEFNKHAKRRKAIAVIHVTC